MREPITQKKVQGTSGLLRQERHCVTKRLLCVCVCVDGDVGECVCVIFFVGVWVGGRGGRSFGLRVEGLEFGAEKLQG